MHPRADEVTSPQYLHEHDRVEGINGSRSYTQDSMSGVSYGRSGPNYEHQSEPIDRSGLHRPLSGQNPQERPQSDTMNDIMGAFHSLSRTGISDEYSCHKEAIRLRTGSLDIGRLEDGRTGFRNGNHYSPSSPYDDSGTSLNRYSPRSATGSFPTKSGLNTSSSSSSSSSNPPPSNSRYKHVCTVCGKDFPRPTGLSTHMNSHTGEQPFACIVPGCAKRFSVQSNARRHLSTHGIDPKTARLSAEPSLPFTGFEAPVIATSTQPLAVPTKLKWVGGGPDADGEFEDDEGESTSE